MRSIIHEAPVGTGFRSLFALKLWGSFARRDRPPRNRCSITATANLYYFYEARNASSCNSTRHRAQRDNDEPRITTRLRDCVSTRSKPLSDRSAARSILAFVSLSLPDIYRRRKIRPAGLESGISGLLTELTNLHHGYVLHSPRARS